MIKKLVRQMLAAQILSALTVSLCLLIDNLMIGRYLGERALTAYGLSSPVLLVIGAVGSMLCAGAQVACGKSLGRGDREETDIGYSSAVAVAAVFSLAFTIVVALIRVPLARLLGADEPALLADTSQYMAGFVIGAPASMGALILVPFLQMAGQGNLLIAAVLGMTVADVGFDLLNVLVFHGGMFGMGLASSLSYYVAMLIGGGYFLSKKCVFKFSVKRILRRKLRELVEGGVPTIIGMAASVVLIFAVNKLLMGIGGKQAVAAFAVISTIVNASNCISTGTGGVALTLSGVLYNEEDRSGLAELLRLLSRRAALLLGNIAGVTGVWFYFITGEVLTLFAVMAYVWRKKGGVTWRAEDVLLLRGDFGVPEKDRLEANLADLDAVMDFSRSAERFCLEHGGGERLASHLALCVEEMGTNIVTHGFAGKDGNSLSIRLQVKEGRWTLRFRDDCTAFDPLSHIEQDEGASLGIRLAMRVADEARYTYSMNLNNLMLTLRGI